MLSKNSSIIGYKESLWYKFDITMGVYYSAKYCLHKKETISINLDINFLSKHKIILFSHILQCHNVHGCCQCGHHYPDTQLSSSKDRDSRNATVGKSQQILFPINFWERLHEKRTNWKIKIIFVQFFSEKLIKTK